MPTLRQMWGAEVTGISEDSSQLEEELVMSGIADARSDISRTKQCLEDHADTAIHGNARDGWYPVGFCNFVIGHQVDLAADDWRSLE